MFKAYLIVILVTGWIIKCPESLDKDAFGSVHDCGLLTIKTPNWRPTVGQIDDALMKKKMDKRIVIELNMPFNVESDKET